MPLNNPKTPRSPIFAVIVPKAKVVSMAPHLPTAADMPWAVARTRVGKTSTGMRNVVVAGPALRKN
jgi:hypothetical protein